ncbi:MAG TPA: hypothetical protein VFL47_05085, partial [Flavisolibacter sp.]|nr:hypothetical protein [Flavisolibacter sp.]
MRTLSAVLLTVVTTAIFSACKQNSIVLDDTTAKGEVPQLGNLHFRFNKALHPDSLLNFWDSTDYLSFEPSIPGRFRWEGPEELVFSPSQPLAPATTYTVKFKDELFRYSEYNKVEGDAPTFHTAPLQMGDAQLTWLASSGTGVAAPQITLRFNYPVKAEDVKEKLTVKVDGEESAYALQNTGVTSMINVRLNELKAEDKNHQAIITIEPGLKPDKGSNSTKDALTQSLAIPSPYVLTISNVEAEHTGTEGLVRLYTNQLLNASEISRYLSFEPAVPFTVETTDFGAILRSSKFDAETSYALNISKGLRGQLGGELKEEYNGAVGFGKLESNIRFTNSKAIYLSKSGAGNIEVQITNTPRIKLIISKIYENNLLQ